MKKSKGEYALYKGEKIIMFGTLEEVAKAQGVKRKTILYYSTKSYLKRMEKSRLKNYKVLVKVS